ncbi:MAG: molybdopterin molybdotransferase MoeA [Terricaulis sp.]
MISVAEARATILAHIERTKTEMLAIEACLGRTLGEPVRAARAQPPFHASAMDGYAVRSADTPGKLRLVGEAGAGHALQRSVGPGECARIFTGAPLPQGADAIAIQEEVTRDGARIDTPAVAPGKHVRAPGVDFPAGATLLEPGLVLSGAHLAVAAAAGRDAITVAVRPRITILSGGDEIVAPGAAARPDQIFDCASFGVAGLAQAWGAASTRGAILPDNADFIAAAIETASAASDLVVLIGGASVGDHDHARRAVQSLGADVLFDKVSLRPGKPTWFALRGKQPILGLPGNPGSALVAARLFLRPLIAAMLGGDSAQTVETRRAKLSATLPANGPREAYLRANTRIDQEGRLCVAAAANQDSSLVSVFAAANALIVCPANADARDVGDLADIIEI